MYRKKITLGLLLALTGSFIHGATVRVYNKSSHPIFARINQSMAGDAPNFKKILPNKSAFFNSDFDNIKKVTFLRAAGHKKVTLPENQIIDYVNDTFYTKNSLMHARDGYVYTTVNTRGPETIEIEDKTTGKTTKIRKSYHEDVTISVPVIQEYIYNLGSNYIGFGVTEARIDYNGWQKAKRVKRKFLGLF